MLTSKQLWEGRVYTRADLRQRFGIADATINNGLFRPSGHDSVWLFVTERKTPDRTQYVDQLDGDTLYWDGQTAGRTDDLIIEHEQRGLELLLFYRTTKGENPGAGFRYEGRFRYTRHSGEHPAHFVLTRLNLLLETAERDIEAAQVEEGQLSSSFKEGTIRATLVNRYERNPKLRAEAIRIHGTHCHGCGFNFAEVYGDRGEGFIEVHHLQPISTYGGEVAVDPAQDMAVLCANCHRMVHRDPARVLTLDELQSIIQAIRAVREGGPGTAER